MGFQCIGNKQNQITMQFKYLSEVLAFHLFIETTFAEPVVLGWWLLMETLDLSRKLRQKRVSGRMSVS